MKLFTTFGSWGEIAPLLEIALQLQDQGESVCFMTTDNWADRVEAYGVKCWSLPPHQKHADTLDEFLKAQALGRAKVAYELCEKIKPSSMVASLYSFGALAYAANHDIKATVTTTSPHYFMDTEPAPAFNECIEEANHLTTKDADFQTVGLYPWYLANDVGIPCLGFPELRSLFKLSDRVAKFIEEPYGVITCGTLVDVPDLDRMVNAIHAHGLKCLYLGNQPCKADLSVYFDHHAEAVKKANVCITHAGIGTTIDCMGLPMVVAPRGYDQFYNAQRLINMHVAVPNGDSYIKAITYAQRPRSYLPNQFSLDAFMGLHDPQRHLSRHPRNPEERAHVH